MYMSAGADSQAYKRLGKTLDLTGRTAPKLNFKFSGDVEDNWDWVVVEARDVDHRPEQRRVDDAARGRHRRRRAATSR